MGLAHESADSSTMDLTLLRPVSHYVHRCLYLFRNSMLHIITIISKTSFPGKWCKMLKSLLVLVFMSMTNR